MTDAPEATGEELLQRTIALEEKNRKFKESLEELVKANDELYANHYEMKKQCDDLERRCDALEKAIGVKLITRMMGKKKMINILLELSGRSPISSDDDVDDSLSSDDDSLSSDGDESLTSEEEKTDVCRMKGVD